MAGHEWVEPGASAADSSAGVGDLIFQLDYRYAVLRRKFSDVTATAPAPVSRFMSDYRSAAVEYSRVAALVAAQQGDVPGRVPHGQLEDDVGALADRVGSLADRVDALNAG